jgi:hypothetical protein
MGWMSSGVEEWRVGKTGVDTCEQQELILAESGQVYYIINRE